MLCIAPIFLIYFGTIVLYFILKFKRFNKFIFPMIVFNSQCLIFVAGTGAFGVAFGWLIFMTLPLTLILIILGIIYGWINDHNYKKELRSLRTTFKK